MTVALASASALDNDWGQFVMIDVQQTSVSTNTKRFKPVLDPFFEYNETENNVCRENQGLPCITEPFHYKIGFDLIQNVHWLFSQSVFHIGQKLLLFYNGKQ